MLIKSSLTLFVTILSWFALIGQTSEQVRVGFANVGPYAQTGAKQSVYCIIDNNTDQLVSNVNLLWQFANGEPESSELKQLSIQPWSVKVVELPAQISIGNPGEHSIHFWVDNVNGSPQTDPDTLTLGFVALEQTAQRSVLFENFTSIGCGTCSSANPMLRQLADKFGNKTFFIAYHTDCYSGNPMCQMVSSDIEERKELYDVLYTPYSVLSRYYSNNSLSFENIYFDYELHRPSPISIEGQFEIIGSSVVGSVNLLPFTSIATQNLIVQLAINQDIVTYTTPPGSNGEKVFYHVLRRFVKIPNTELETLAQGLPLNFSFAEDFSGLNVDMSLIRVAAFVQDTSTHEVLQAMELQNSTTSVDPLISATRINVYPNPSTNLSDLTIELPFAVSKPHKVLVHSMLGQIILEQELATGSSFVHIATGNLNKGVYLIMVNGAEVNGSQKLIVQ